MLRPKKVPTEDKPFKRRSRPTPQASRLLTVSMMSGVILIILLAVVFIPRGLDWEGRQPPRIELEARPKNTQGWFVNVTSVSKELNASLFDVELLVGGTPVMDRTALPDLVGPGLPVRYWDRDGDGLLTAGDQFDSGMIDTVVFVVYHNPSGARIAYVPIP